MAGIRVRTALCPPLPGALNASLSRMDEWRLKSPPSSQTEMDMKDLLRYEDNLIACYEAEYHLSMRTAGLHPSPDGMEYPDTSEVLTSTSLQVDGPQGALCTPMEESAPHEPCSDCTNLGSAPWPGMEGVGRHQTSAAIGNGLPVLSADKADSLMELDHTSLEVGGLESSCGAVQFDENTPPSLLGASLHDYKLSLHIGLTPCHTPSEGSNLASHQDGPQRKRSCMRAPEH